MEQLTGDRHGGRHSHRLGTVDGLVTQVLDQLNATQRLHAHEIAEVVGMDQLGEARFSPRPLQLGIVVVHPLHQQLDRAAGVEAGGAGIGEGELLDLERLLCSSGHWPAIRAYCELIDQKIAPYPTRMNLALWRPD
jgi:hypothetical protein